MEMCGLNKQELISGQCSQRLTALCNAVESCGVAVTREEAGADCAREGNESEEGRQNTLTKLDNEN